MLFIYEWPRNKKKVEQERQLLTSNEPIDKQFTTRSISKNDSAKPRIRDLALRNIPRQLDDARIFIIFTFSWYFSFRPSARTMMQLIHSWIHIYKAVDPSLSLRILKSFFVIWIHDDVSLLECRSRNERIIFNKFCKCNFLSH